MATLSYRPTARHANTPRVARPLPSLAATDSADDCHDGPGWFASTWELAVGLEVRELDTLLAPLAIAFAPRATSSGLAV